MIKNVFMRWFWCLHEYLMIFPLFIIAAFFAVPKDVVLSFTLLLPFSLLFGIAVTCVKEKIKNIFIFIIGLIYVAGVTFLWQYAAMGGSLQEILVTAAFTAGFFIWGIKSGTGNTRIDFYYFFGLVIYGASILFINNAPNLKEFLNITIAAAILLVFAGFPLANRRFLIQETRQKSSLKIIPGTVVRGNIIIVIGIIIATVLFSLWDTVLDAIVTAAKAIVVFIIKAINWFSSLFMPEETQSEGGGAQDLELPPGGETNSVVNIILTVITVGIFLILIYTLVKYIVKNHKRIYAAIQSFFSRLFGRFRQWSSTEQGYSDRQESLLKTEFKKRPSILKRIFQRKPAWKDMKDNPSRIRFIYAKFVSDNIRKGFSFRQSDTPNETVSRINALHPLTNETLDHEGIRTEYNKVRYGGKEPSDEKVNELKQIYVK